MRVRGEISKKKEHYMDKNRYYELKFFCLQYDTWVKAYEALDGMTKAGGEHVDGGDISDPTAKCAEARDSFLERVMMIRDAAKETSEELGKYILLGVTKGLSYDILNARYGIPCCRKIYYQLYRQFFWILSHKRL